MGVKGLTTYINIREETFLQYFLLHDSPLVIDGHSLCAQLYRRLNCFSAFGGDYDKFASYVRSFFKNLRKCNITPYVLFDGTYEQRKLKTAFSRVLSRIKGASQLDPVTQGSLHIFPLLLGDVFIEALTDMQVQYTVCVFEADNEIAMMARHLNCPVLSYDSDFFIYNVLYIPFNTLECKPIPLDEGGVRFYALECKIYKVEHMSQHFGIKEELLPLLATLLGNDFVEKRVFNKFFSQLKLAKSKMCKNEKQKCIHGLFKWLENETLESAIAKILGRFTKEYKNKALIMLKNGIEGYNSTHCHSLKYFDIPDVTETKQHLVENIKVNADMYEEKYVEDQNDNEVSDNEDILTEDGDSCDEGDSYNTNKPFELPEYIAEKICYNQISRAYSNLYTHNLFFCSPQAEDYTDEDSCLCCLPIMRFAFDIMTDFSLEYFTYVSRIKDKQYERIYVNNEYSIPRLLDVPFGKLTEGQLKLYFYHFLKHKMELLDLAVIELLPTNFQLYMIAILWWVNTCHVPLGNIHSLLMCYVMLEVIDEKIGMFRGHYHFNNKYATKLVELKDLQCNFPDENDLYLNKNKVQYGDCLVAASTLLQLFELDDKIKRKPKSYDVKKMHSFAQFQCCLMHINSLNTLCCNPFQSTKYSKSFNGTFVYNMAVKLENQLDPNKFFGQYIKGAITVFSFYESLCKLFHKCADMMNLKTATHKTVKKRRKKRNAELEEINFIVKGFESEVVI